MTQIRTRGDPGAGIGVDFLCDGEGALEELDSLWEMIKVVEHDSELVEEQRVGLTELVRGVEEFLRESHVVELEVLHTKEELGEVRSLEEAGGSAVGGDGLVMLAFRSKGVGEANPGGAEVRVHHRGFGEEAPGFSDLVDVEIVNAYCEPGGGFVGVEVGEAVGEEEKGVCLV